MKYQPVKQGDIIVLNDGVHVAVHVSIKKDTDIFKYCNSCSLHYKTECYIMNCKDTHFKISEGGL